MDRREQLRNFLNSMINDKPEEAALDLHQYLVPKMREVAGLAQPASDVDPVDVDPAGDTNQS